MKTMTTSTTSKTTTSDPLELMRVERAFTVQPRVEVIIDDIHCDDGFNSRGTFSEASVYELAKSIDSEGLWMPIELCNYTYGPEKYFLVAGFRRLKAHVYLGRTTILANINHGMTESDARRLNWIENERVNLTPLQQAIYIASVYGEHTDAKIIAKELGHTVRWVQLRLALLKLPEDIQQQVVLGSISLLDAERIAKSVKGAENQRAAVERRKIESAIKREKTQVAKKTVMSRDSIQRMISWMSRRGITGLPIHALMWSAGLMGFDDFQRYVGLEIQAKSGKFSNPK